MGAIADIAATDGGFDILVDLIAYTGVAHVIDGVLPPLDAPTPAARVGGGDALAGGEGAKRLSASSPATASTGCAAPRRARVCWIRPPSASPASGGGGV